MCGRYTLRTKLNLLLDQFAAEMAEAQVWDQPRYNVAPSQEVLAVRGPEPGAKRQLVALKWDSHHSWLSESREPLLDELTVDLRRTGPSAVGNGLI